MIFPAPLRCAQYSMRRSVVCSSFGVIVRPAVMLASRRFNHGLAGGVLRPLRDLQQW